ncbi:MAG: M14 family metallopeptidase [Clostridiales bacterium]|nr:M14 family metallopeptidase [Clostridiales bacterium]
MFIDEIYRAQAPYREPMTVKGYRFGKGEKAACILGPMRGNEIQQLYICSQLVRVLKELEGNGCISSGKEILVVPVVNSYAMNVGKRFWGVENMDINRSFPGASGGETAARIAAGVFGRIKDYSYGIQLASFYMAGEFVPHVRMMETGYQNTSLANLFGLPYVVVRKPRPIDTKTLNYNWQDEMTAAFSLYTNQNTRVDEASAEQAVAAVLRFLTRMGIIRYESHSGYISHVIVEEDLSDIHAASGGIFRGFARAGTDVRYGYKLAEIIDPYEGNVKETLVAPTDGIVFFAHTEDLITENDMAYRLIHRLHA